MPKNRSTSRSRSDRFEAKSTGGSRYDRDDYRAGYNREQDYDREGNGGSRSRSAESVAAL
jgi:hypothetical protein